MYKCLFVQIAREIILLLINNLHKKRITDSQNGQNFAFEICIRAITLRSCYMKNTLVFDQSDARDFLMYINTY